MLGGMLVPLPEHLRHRLAPYMHFRNKTCERFSLQRALLIHPFHGQVSVHT